MKKSLVIMVSLGILAASLAMGNGSAVAQVPETSHLYKAYRMLSRAHYVLRQGTRADEVRRHAALQQVGAAIQELRLAASVDHQTLPSLSESGTPAAAPTEIHHHAWMRDALRQCQGAKSELQAMPNDPGGHRTTALQHVDAAIAGLEQIVKQK